MPILNYPDDMAQDTSSFRALDLREGKTVSPSVWETVSAAARQDNIVGSWASNKLAGIDLLEKEEGFSGETVWSEIKGTNYANHWDRFAGVFNRRGFEAMKAQIDMESQDRRTLEGAGALGVAASFGASLVDLPTLLPGGAIVRGATTGATIARTALTTAAAGALAAGVSEAALQATQETRPWQESAMAIGAGAVLGGALGAGAGALFSKVERQAAYRAIDEARMKPVDSDEALSEFRAGAAESVGAASVARDTLEDLTIAGKGARAVGKSTAKLNPVLRAAHSPSAAHRSVMANLQETGFYLEKNLRGEGDIAVETAIKYWDRGALGDALTRSEQTFRDARKGGMELNSTEFRQQVAMAMRREDVGINDAVSSAARTWRSKLFDPLKDEAIEVGLLPADVQPSTAASYFSRLWSTPKLEAGEARFKQIVRGWLDDKINEIETRDGLQKSAKGEKLEFVSAADRQDYINQISDDIFQTLTGRARQGALSYDVVVAKRGPLKERTFNIPDELVEEFLENDVELVGRRYARIMSADVELTRKFGSPTMERQIADISADYQKMRDEVIASDKPPAQKEKELRFLGQRERRDITDLEGIRDVFRGQYKVDSQNTNFARVLNTAMAFNYIRTMGGVLASSLTDVVRPAVVHGLGRYMNEGIKPLVTNLKAVKLAKAEAKQLGAVTEQVLLSRIATMAELADPYQMRSPFERFLNNTTTAFSRMTLLPWWNDVQKTIASVLTQNRLVQNSLGDFDQLPAKEKAYMGFLGIDRFMAERIGKQFDQFGMVEGDIRIPNTEAWTDEGAVRAFAAALNKDVDGTIVTKGAGDIPLFMNTPAGRALGQFKSFALASNQRMLMRGLQEGPGSVATAFVGMTTLGMFVYWLKQTEAGRDVSDNPATWVAEGLDRSGLLAIGMEVNNTFEKMGGPGLYHLAAKAFPNASQAQPASRYAVRSAFGAALGPSFGLGTDVVGAMGTALKAARDQELDLTAGDIGTARRLTPFVSLPYWRWLIDGMIVPDMKEAVQ